MANTGSVVRSVQLSLMLLCLMPAHAQALGLLVVGPLFLMTLLESQGLFYWTGVALCVLPAVRSSVA